MTYFDLNLNLSDEDKAIREAAHKFAKEVMRPMGSSWTACPLRRRSRQIPQSGAS